MTLEGIFHRMSLLSVPLICCLLIGYFAYHAFYGGNGLIAAERLKARIALLEDELELASKTRGEFEKKVALLRPESLDPDMLDEYARSLLGKTHKDDIIIMRSRRPDE